jgi:hypothetical protein
MRWVFRKNPADSAPRQCERDRNAYIKTVPGQVTDARENLQSVLPQTLGGNEVTTQSMHATTSFAVNESVWFEMESRPRADSNCRHTVYEIFNTD